MKLLDSTLRVFTPRLRLGARRLREQLTAHRVTVLLSSGCIEDFVRDADAAVARTRTGEESYESCLERQIEARARFIQLWTGSDEKFDRTEWGELVAIARKYALPRPWKVPMPVASVSRRRPAPVPEHLITSSDGSAGR